MRLSDVREHIGHEFAATVDGRDLRVRLIGITERAERASSGRVVMRRFAKVLPLGDDGKATAAPFLTEAKNIGGRWT